MIVYLDGSLVPEAEARVSIFDRGFLLGDGVFETVPVFGGRLFCWARHEARLVAGLKVIDVAIPCPLDELALAAREVIARNGIAEGVLRVTISRGTGPRGYSPRNAGPATVTIAAHPAVAESPKASPDWRLMTSPRRIPSGAEFSQCKHTSRLIHVLARAEAERAGANDALLLNTRGEVAETTGANVFWMEGGRVCTPSLENGALAGITRALVMELARNSSLEVREATAAPDVLQLVDGVFLTSSTLGVVEVRRLDDATVRCSRITARLRAAYEAVVQDFRSGKGGNL